MSRLKDIFEQFPAGPPLPETQQIGRTAQIDELEERLRVSDVLLLMEGRRTGKTSLASAALDRMSPGGHVAVATLTRFPTYAAAGRFLDAQLQAPARRAGFSLARVLEVFDRSGAPELISGEAADLLGIAGDLVQATATLRADVSTVLASSRGPGAVLLDEAHAMLSWESTEKAAINAVLRGRLRIGVVLASSDGQALDRLAARGEALHLVGSRIRPTPIDPLDWFGSLRDRFQRLDIDIGETVIRDLVVRAHAHPYLTMRLAREVADRATRHDENPVATESLLNAATAALSRDDPVWRELDERG